MRVDSHTGMLTCMCLCFILVPSPASHREHHTSTLPCLTRNGTSTSFPSKLLLKVTSPLSLPANHFENKKNYLMLLLKRVTVSNSLCVNLNIDGAPITSRTHTHPSHSQASRLLTSSLSLGVPVPHSTESIRV